MRTPQEDSQELDKRTPDVLNALFQFLQIAERARAAALRRIADFAGDGQPRTLQSELHRYVDEGRGFLGALTSSRLLTDDEEGTCFEYLVGRREDVPPFVLEALQRAHIIEAIANE